MQYDIRIEGTTGLIQHAGTGLDQTSEANTEIAQLVKKTDSERTQEERNRITTLEVIKSIWFDSKGAPSVPVAAIRSCIERAARKLKQGPAVREGLIVVSSRFEWDEQRYGGLDNIEALCMAVKFTVPVVVGRSRILRTRALFEPPWAVEFRLDTDPELIDENKLRAWMDIAGRRIGLGDWRPEKSGHHGRFRLNSISEAGSV